MVKHKNRPFPFRICSHDIYIGRYMRKGKQADFRPKKQGYTEKQRRKEEKTMILYPNTEKELFFSDDYKPLPDLKTLDYTGIMELLENVVQACYNAIDNGAGMLEIALCEDIIEINKYRFIDYLSFVSSGRIAIIIGNSKYTEIDKAVNAALQYINDNEECLLDIGIDNAGIEEIIRKAYKQKESSN